MSKEKKVVIVKDYRYRGLSVILLSNIFLILLTGVFAIPFMVKPLLNLIILSIIVTGLAELVVGIWGLWITDQLKEWKKATIWRMPENKKQLLIGLGVGAAMWGMIQLIASLLITLGVDLQGSDTSEALGELKGIDSVIGLIIFASFLFPLLEEWFFRGVVFSSALKSEFFKNHANTFALIVSSIVFALAHFQGAKSPTDIFVLAATFITACVMGSLRIRYNSLFVCYVCHMTYNLISSVTTLLGM